MAALLPHHKLSLDDKLNPLIDGNPTDSTQNREKILQLENPGNVAITYKQLLSMKQAEQRERISNAQVVYIYHNCIDAIGEENVTEDQVFAACEQAINELCNLVKLIGNGLNGTNILITADHGFIYSYKNLKESDKADKDLISGEILELDRRYAIADGNSDANYLIKIPLNHFLSSLSGFAPLEYIRLLSGGGMKYVHGGVSLQELVVPVIEFKNLRSSSKNYVETNKAELQLLTSSNKISNNIFSLNFFQKDAVKGKVVAETYLVYFTDEAGNHISDDKTIIADKTSEERSDRIFRVRFALKNGEFIKQNKYYLNVDEKSTMKPMMHLEFVIDITFTNDFGL